MREARGAKTKKNGPVSFFFVFSGLIRTQKGVGEKRKGFPVWEIALSLLRAFRNRGVLRSACLSADRKRRSIAYPRSYDQPPYQIGGFLAE
ncbi:hypothetical protein D4R51_03665 [bacterium]|nr:MAG: hypothetical protein D4R51_03665 [bacterium]